MAIAKLITGWMCIAIIGMTQVNFDQTSTRERGWPEGSIFRIFAAILIALATAVLTPDEVDVLFELVESLAARGTGPDLAQQRGVRVVQDRHLAVRQPFGE